MCVRVPLPHQPLLTFCSPHPSPLRHSQSRKEGRERSATGPDEKAHCTLMKQLPGGQTHYRRLMIWFNHVDKIRGQDLSLPLQNAAGLKGWEEPSMSGCPRHICSSTESQSVYVYMPTMCSKSHLFWNLFLSCHYPAIKAAEVWAWLRNPSPLSGWKLSFNELCSALPGH